MPTHALTGHHPLDPLDQQEVAHAAQSCRDKAAALGLPPLRFNTITLQVCERGHYAQGTV